MMVATYKCGCPPPPDKEPCSPCCASGKTSPPTPPPPQDCPASSCCRHQPPKPIISLPRIEEPPACCPMEPPKVDFERPSQLRSEIAEKGLPYKEFEVIINDNKLVIRTQKEEVKAKYEPPCDCVEDTTPRPTEDSEEVDASPAPGTRTVTLFPRPKYSDPEVAEQMKRKQELEARRNPKTIEQEENPNIFVLRVKKTSKGADKRFNIDLEFKTPRPWSRKKRLEYEAKTKLAKPADPVEAKGEDARTARKAKRSSKKKKKK